MIVFENDSARICYSNKSIGLSLSVLLLYQNCGGIKSESVQIFTVNNIPICNGNLIKPDKKVFSWIYYELDVFVYRLNHNGKVSINIAVPFIA